MSTASLCSSTLQSKINGFGGGLKLQRQSPSHPNSLIFTRCNKGDETATAQLVMEMELPPSKNKGSSFVKTCFNGLNSLSGVGIITIPYTLSQGGWLSLIFLLAMAIVTCFTGLLLQQCMDSKPEIETYPDIGKHAFGRKGEIIVSTITYLELYLVPVGFLILEGDNLHKLFPNYVGFQVGGHSIGGEQIFTMVAGLVILPSMWLKDLSLLSFISACGVLSTIIIIGSILWVGAFDGVGFSGQGEVLKLGGIPTALSLYAFCYGAHPVFPTLYSSMKDKNQFSKESNMLNFVYNGLGIRTHAYKQYNMETIVIGSITLVLRNNNHGSHRLFSIAGLFICFGLSTLSYISMAVIGYLMFGKTVQSQVTWSLPANKFSSRIPIYTVLVGPLAKYTLTITPVAEAIESSLPSHWCQIKPICILIRTLLLASTIIVALVFPFFELLMALVGAIITVTGSILLPCICYLKINSEAYRRWSFELVIIVGTVMVAVSVGVMGTYSALEEIVKQL